MQKRKQQENNYIIEDSSILITDMWEESVKS